SLARKLPPAHLAPHHAASELPGVGAAALRGIAGDVERRDLLRGRIEVAPIAIDELHTLEHCGRGDSRTDGRDVVDVARRDAPRVQAQLTAGPREWVAVLHAQLGEPAVISDTGRESFALTARLRDDGLGGHGLRTLGRGSMRAQA